MTVSCGSWKKRARSNDWNNGMVESWNDGSTTQYSISGILDALTLMVVDLP